MWAFILLLLIAAFALLPAVASDGPPTASIAIAQAGSAGGIIGKQNKSVSGREAAQPSRPTRKEQPRRARRQALAETDSGTLAGRRAFTMTGAWRWRVDCEKRKNFNGIMNLVQNGSEFAGQLGGTNFYDTGTVYNGRVEGLRVSFDRTLAGVGQFHFDGTVSSGGRVISGPYESSVWGACQVTLRK